MARTHQGRIWGAGSSGGTGLTSGQATQVASIPTIQASLGDKADEATVTAALADKADKSVVDAVIAANATQAELDAALSGIFEGEVITDWVRATDGRTTTTYSKTDAGLTTTRAVITSPVALPATTDIVNDRVTGGATKALSAEQGKLTKDELEAHITNLVTTIRDAANSEDTKYPSEKSVRAAIDSLSGNFLGLTDTFNAFTGLALQVLRVNAAEDAVEAIALAAALVAYDDTATTLPGTPTTSQAAIEALKALIDGQTDQTDVADFPSLPAVGTATTGDIVHVVDASGDPLITTGWAKYQLIGGTWFLYLSQEQLNVALLTDAQAQDRASVVEGTASGKLLSDRDQALQGTEPDFTATDGSELVAKPWAGKTINDRIIEAKSHNLKDTYGLNERVYNAAAGGYFKSAQAGNRGNALNDPAWWEADLDETAVYIRNLGAVATLTDAALLAKFPVGDESRPLDIIEVGDVAYQMKIGATDPQVASSWEPVSLPGTLFLNEITIPIRSAGTNAGSSVDVVLYDRNGDAYAPSNFLLNGTLTQYTGGTAEINFVDSPFNGRIGIGRNKAGSISWSWKSDVSLMNGLSRVDVTGNSGGSVNGPISGSFIGSSESFSHPANADIVPPEEFTSQTQTAYDDNPDLTVNTGVGMTRQGLQSLFGGVDAAAAWDTDGDYTGADNKPFSLQPNPTPINGPYVTADNVVLEAGKLYNLKYRLDRPAADSVAVLADDVASVQEVALMDYIGVTGTGKADKTLDLNPRFLGGAFKAVITSIPPSLLMDGIAFSDKDEIWVYHAGLSPTDVAGMTTLEPDTKANPGVDDGFWVRQGGGATAKNGLAYPVGNFTSLPVNDAGIGVDGLVYKLPTVDALQITLPNKADMDAAEGLYRVRISGDWAALSTQTTVLSFIDDTANGVDMGTGLPDDGNEWLDLVYDAANDKWIATSGGDVTLTQIIPTYATNAEVPANVRLYLIDGTGVSAEGLYRKETVGNAPNHIG